MEGAMGSRKAGASPARVLLNMLMGRAGLWLHSLLLCIQIWPRGNVGLETGV